MSNFTHYNDDPLFAAAAAILEGKQIETTSELDEGVEEIKAKAKNLKVGDKTNFGVIVAIGSDSITFKAKDLPKTKIPFNQRKMGSRDFVLDRIVKLKEETEKVDSSITEAVGLAANMLKGQIVSLLQLNTSVKVAHWRASTSVNTHKALGDLYDAVESSLDSFIETEMGISRNRQFLNMSFETRADYSVPALVNELRERAEALLNTSKGLGCEDLANIAADLLGSVNKAAYLLEV
jgi:DNA-binding ferritin-like protein